MEGATGLGKRLGDPPELGVSELNGQLDGSRTPKGVGNRPRDDCDERETG